MSPGRAAAAAAVLSSLTGAAEAQDPPPDRALDVSALLRRTPDVLGPAVAAGGLLLERETGGGIPGFGEAEGVAVITESAIVALVDHVAGPGAASVSDGRLRIVAPDATRARALDLVAWLAARDRPAGEVRVEWLDLPPATALRLLDLARTGAPVFDAARWAEARAACAAAGLPLPPSRARATLRVAPGRRGGAGDVRARAHVWNYETEVEGATRAAHPLVRSCLSGWRVDVRPGRRDGGATWLGLRSEAIALPEPESVETGHGRVALPAPVGTLVAAAVGLRDGERIVLGAADSGLGGGYVVVEWRADPGPVAGGGFPLGDDELRCHDVAAWGPAVFGAPELALGDDGGLYVYVPDGMTRDWSEASWQTQAGSLVAGAALEGGARLVADEGARRWVAAPRAVHEEIARRLAQAAEAWRPVWVEAVLLAAETTDVTPTLDTVSSTAVLAHAVVAATPDALAAASRIRRRPRLADHEVEVAPVAMVDDPVIRAALEGFTCEVLARPGIGDRIGMTLRVVTGRLREPAPTFEVRPASITHLDVDMAEATWELDLPAGQWIVRPWPAGADGRPRAVAIRATRG